MSGYKVKPSFPILKKGHPLTRGLLAAWAFYEKAGTRLTDVSGKRRHGTLVNSPTWTSSQHGVALDFDGTDYVDIGNVPTVPLGTNPRTFSVWFATDTFSTDGLSGLIMQVHPSTAVGKGLGIDCEDNAISIAFYGHRRITPTSTLVAGTWYLVTVVFPVGATTTAHVLVYINGILQTTTDKAGSPQSLLQDAVDIHLGNNYAHSSSYDGKIDDVCIWNRDLSATEVKQLYDEPYGIYESPRSIVRFLDTGTPPAVNTRRYSLTTLGVG